VWRVVVWLRVRVPVRWVREGMVWRRVLVRGWMVLMEVEKVRMGPAATMATTLSRDRYCKMVEVFILLYCVGLSWVELS
jgi:hypothetical protein